MAALGLDKAKNRRDALAQQAAEALASTGLGDRVATLAEAARFTVARKN